METVILFQVLASTAKMQFLQYFIVHADMYRSEDNFGHGASLPAASFVQIKHAEAEVFVPCQCNL